MEKQILKHKMKSIITFLCVLAVTFTIVIGMMGFMISSDISKNASYIHTYQRYSNLVNEIYADVLETKVLVLESEKNYNADTETKIKKFDGVIRANIDEYN